MGRKRSAACLAFAVLALGISACSGDEGEADRDRQAAMDFALAVERISAGLTNEGADALTALNKVAGKSLEPRSAIAVLERYSDAATSAERRLGRLSAPAAAASTAENLEFAMRALDRSIEFTATDIRIARREREDVPRVARAGARVILAHYSGVRQLSSALNALVDASVSDS